MPNQTTETGYIYYPDGARVSIKSEGDSEYYDLGAINSAVTNTLNWTQSKVETANAGSLAPKLSDFLISGGFTLINLNPKGIAKLGGGLFHLHTVDGASVTPKVQVVSKAKSENTYNLIMLDPTSGHVLRTKSKPTLSSVKAGSTAVADYTIVASTNSQSGWSIVLHSGSITGESDLTVTYGSITPIARTSVTCGSSSVVLKPSAMKISHIDSLGKERSLELPCVYSTSGGFQFNFKGANEDGVEEMPITYEAQLDINSNEGQQLLSWNIDEGAA